MADFLNGLIISEILADNPNVTGGLDTNSDGTIDKSDEYVEIQNTTGADISLAGYRIFSQENGLLHAFDAGDVISAQGTALVLGNANNGGIPNYYSANGNSNGAQGNGGFLEDGEGNKDDTIYLVAPNGDYVRFSYGDNPVIPTTLPDGFPVPNELQGAGESLVNGAGNTRAFGRNENGDFEEQDPTPGVPGIPCFVAGTLIATDQGHVRVENLTPGMRVLTRDNGYVALRAVRAAAVTRAELRWNPDLCPVQIPAHAFGNDAPLVVSPAHRILVTGAEVEVLCGTAEALVSAHHLVGHAGISRLPTWHAVTYCHLLFDNHEIVQSDGLWSESLFLGDIAHAAIRAAADWQVADGCELAQMSHRQTARVVLKSYEAKVLFADTTQLAATIPYAA